MVLFLSYFLRLSTWKLFFALFWSINRFLNHCSQALSLQWVIVLGQLLSVRIVLSRCACFYFGAPESNRNVHSSFLEAVIWSTHILLKPISESLIFTCHPHRTGYKVRPDLEHDADMPLIYPPFLQFMLKGECGNQVLKISSTLCKLAAWTAKGEIREGEIGQTCVEMRDVTINTESPICSSARI